MTGGQKSELEKDHIFLKNEKSKGFNALPVKAPMVGSVRAVRHYRGQLRIK